jgi:succinate dehydrogenase / fumarate reductase flavoprotein subunit
MQDDSGIARSDASLKRALAAIEELKLRAQRMRVKGSRLVNPGWHTCRDVDNMLVISEAIVSSAIERRESRGSQWRLDFPDKSDEQGRVNYVAVRGDAGMRIRAIAVEPAPAHLLEPIRAEEELRARSTIPIAPAVREPAASRG